MKRIVGLQLAGNAALILLLYFWLGIRDARAWQILLTVVLGAVWIAGAVWLHVGTWHWMRAGSWRVPRRTLLRTVGIVAVFLLALGLLSLIPVDRAALWTASLLTFKSRKPLSPDLVARCFHAILWLMTWFVLPVVMLGQSKRPRFWILFAAALCIGWYVPQQLVHWAPEYKSTVMEVVSLLLRWGVAYVLAVAGWLFVLRDVRGVQQQATV